MEKEGSNALEMAT